ncbi:MAG: AraC family transcriptional regulator [Pseudomonadota bacterium]
MKIVQRAIWFIESHLADPIGLSAVAAASGASRFHLSRSFAHVVSQSVSSYMRSRRLSEAAKLLADGNADILNVALSVGYGSHEAFTRAFHAQFGVLPTHVKTQRTCAAITLQEPFFVPTDTTTRLDDPSYRNEGPLLLAGIREFRTFEERAGIPDQWRRFVAVMGDIANQNATSTFGVCFEPAHDEEGFDYMAAVSVSSLDDLPEGLTGVRLPKRRYAVFQHKDHVSTIGATCAAIFGDWKQATADTLETSPTSMIECYGRSFDPETGRGGFEVWIPIESDTNS